MPPDALVMVHGFGYDPEAVGPADPRQSLYPRWCVMAQRPATGFAWYSVPPGLRHLARAWMRGHWNRYHYAWSLAEQAGSRLARLLDRGPPADILCHSLGSRVVLCALEEHAPARRVLIFNGAAETGQALDIARRRPEIEFLNVVVRSDDVLDKAGEWFTPTLGQAEVIGSKGLRGAPANWTDIPLDDPDFRARARRLGYDLRGDNPRSVGDHWYSYDWEPNWELWRGLLDGRVPAGLMIG